MQLIGFLLGVGFLIIGIAGIWAPFNYNLQEANVLVLVIGSVLTLVGLFVMYVTARSESSSPY